MSSSHHFRGNYQGCKQSILLYRVLTAFLWLSNFSFAFVFLHTWTQRSYPLGFATQTCRKAMSGQNPTDPGYPKYPVARMFQSSTWAVRIGPKSSNKFAMPASRMDFSRYTYHTNNSLSILYMQLICLPCVCVCLGHQSRRVFGGSGKDVRGGS